MEVNKPSMRISSDIDIDIINIHIYSYDII